MRRKQGISLIVLVITIIVMVILAASVIISLSDAGIINKANDAVDKTNASEVQNLATLAWAEEFMSGKRGDSLKEAVLEALKDYTDKYDIDVSDTGVSVNKKGDGTVVGIDWDAILADANANPNKYKHPEQTESEDIGIGTDGKPVNMDYWLYVVNGEIINLRGGMGSSFGTAYVGEYTAKGEIIGKMPQYIKPTGKDAFIPVTDLSYGFYGDKNLKVMPEIPASVVYMEYTFYDCENLTTVSKIPASVIYMASTFRNCFSLTTAPAIPASVVNMRETFEHCRNLITVPEMSASVENMEYTFYGCEKLTTVPEIPATVINMNSTFYGCENLTTVPAIPASVVYMDNTFLGCNSLTGDLIINANPTQYDGCLWAASTNEGTNLKLSGTSTMLNEILNTTSENSNISLK